MNKLREKRRERRRVVFGSLRRDLSDCRW